MAAGSVRRRYLLELMLSPSGKCLAYIPIFDDFPDGAEEKAERIMKALQAASPVDGTLYGPIKRW